MLDNLKRLAKEAIEKDDEVSKKVGQIRDENCAPDNSNESFLIKKEKSSIPDASVCGIDGGILHERMHGIDVVAVRAAGVCFTYSGQKVAKSSYLPKRIPDYSVFSRSGLDEHEAMAWKGITRWAAELDCATEALNEMQPDFLFLDGSIKPHPSMKPAGTSPTHHDYLDLEKKQKGLLEKCSHGCALAGVIKDTRATTLSDYVMPGMQDSLLSWHLLEEGERTCCMKLDDTTSCFYIRPSIGDIPLRIEFPGTDFGLLPSIINGLSAISRQFAYPSVLIEADMCAAMNPCEMEWIRSSLVKMSGGRIRPMRRNSRPFR